MKILLFLDFFVFFVTSLTLVLCIFLGYRRASPACSTPEYSFISCLRIWHLKLWLILIRQVSLINLWWPIIRASFAVTWLLLALVWC
jgi:ABC-type taurine transport system substrate-binding protein